MRCCSAWTDLYCLRTLARSEAATSAMPAASEAGGRRGLVEQIEAGLKSRTQALAERGFDAEQVDAEIAADKAREQRLGLVLGTTPTPSAPTQ